MPNFVPFDVPENTKKRKMLPSSFTSYLRESKRIFVKLSVSSGRQVTLMITFTLVVETSVTNTKNSPSQDYTHLDDHTTQSFLLMFVPLQ